jgi:hypothetical protein
MAINLKRSSALVTESPFQKAQKINSTGCQSDLVWNGKNFVSYAKAYQLMDSQIVSIVWRGQDPKTKQEFFDFYKELHLAIFGREFHGGVIQTV